MKHILFAMMMLVATQIFAGAPEAKEVQRSYHKHSNLYGQGKYYQISRDNVAYLIYFQWVHATQKKGDQVLIGLPEPGFWSGFNRRGMFNLKVNGISVYDLEPKEIKLLNNTEKAGIEVRYNFSGAQMNLRFFMDSSLPVLHVECEPFAGNKPGCIQTLQIDFAVAPQIDGKPKDSYKRELKTPWTTYDKRGWMTIDPRDTYFVMYDVNYDFSEKNPKSQSPVYLKLDQTFLQKGRIHYGVCAPVTFQLTYKPDARVIAFDLLELTKQLNKNDFMKYLEENKLILGTGK